MEINITKAESAAHYVDVMKLHNKIFAQFRDGEEYTAERSHEKIKDSRDPMIFEARNDDGRLAGFIIGYERIPDYYHIWQLGVDKEFRGRGVATSLYEVVERFAQEHGYKGVTMNTFNKFRNNLRLALKRGYQIYDLEKIKENDPKILMRLTF